MTNTTQEFMKIIIKLAEFCDKHPVPLAADGQFHLNFDDKYVFHIEPKQPKVKSVE